MEKLEEGKCYCNFPILNEDGSKCKFCGGKDPTQIEVKIRQVKPCHEGKFKQFDCLESEDQYGFQTDEHDFRPAWHTWIDKKDCEKLHKLFTEKVRKEFLDKFTNGLPMTSMEATLKSKEFWLGVHAMINYIERELKQELGEIK